LGTGKPKVDDAEETRKMIKMSEDRTLERVVHLRVPNIAESAAMVRAYVQELAERNDADAQFIAEMLLVVGEAFANAVEHGKSTEPIEIKVEIENKNMIVNIWDHGVGFAVEIHQQKIPDLYSERGRGMILMATLSDSCTIASAPGWGTRVTIIRRLRAISNV